jgi:hypothetical protein
MVGSSYYDLSPLGPPLMMKSHELTLRDSFAMDVRQEDLYIPDAVDDVLTLLNEEGPYTEEHWYKINAKARYRFADAMLKEREK